MPVAMALLRDIQNLCPKEVLNFILDLIKYNDNRKNKVQTFQMIFRADGGRDGRSLTVPRGLLSFQITTTGPI